MRDATVPSISVTGGNSSTSPDMPRLYIDGFREVLTIEILNGTATSIVLPTGAGAKLAALTLSAADPLVLRLQNGTIVETIYAQGRTTDTLTPCLRAQEGTGATPGSVGFGFLIGSIIRAPITAVGMRELANVTAPFGMVVATTDPAAAVGILKLQARSYAGRALPQITGPSGLATALQPSIMRNDIEAWMPAGNSTTIVAVGNVALTATGTATAASVATTNRHTYQKRLEYLVTVAATTAVAGFRNPAAQKTIGGPAAGDGGFTFACQWGPATGVATTTGRAWVGMSSSTAAPTDVEPSTITNSVGMGWDAADTNIQLMHRGAGAVTKIDLGASFPVPTADRAKAYELILFSPPGITQSVGYQVTDLGTGAVATGTITTNLPSTTTLLAQRGWMSVGGTSSVIGIALMGLYTETDY